MSVIFLSIIVGFLGLFATLSAFGGETWKPGNGPLHKRITLRGWISLTALSMAFLIGSYKDIRQNREDSAYNSLLASKDDLEQIHAEQMTGLEENLVEVRKELLSARENLKTAIAELERRTLQIKTRIKHDGRISFYKSGSMPVQNIFLEEFSIFTFKIRETDGVEKYIFAKKGKPYFSGAVTPISQQTGTPIYELFHPQYESILGEIITELESEGYGEGSVLEAQHELCVFASISDIEGGTHTMSKYLNIRPTQGALIDQKQNSADENSIVRNCNLAEFKDRVSSLVSSGRTYLVDTQEFNCGVSRHVTCAVLVEQSHGIEYWNGILNE